MATPQPAHEPGDDGVDLHQFRWQRWDGGSHEEFSLQWDNGAWTAEGRVAGPDIHYVIRFAEDWTVRQFLLFRDLEDPDLWLATDRLGRWGEVNGVYRRDLDGCTAVDLADTPFPTGIPALQLDAAVAPGQHADVHVARVEIETLQISRVQRRYVRLTDRSWRIERSGRHHEITLDEHGLVLDAPGEFRRVSRT